MAETAPASVRADQVPTTVLDFFMPGTQPGSLTQAYPTVNACFFCHGDYGEEAIFNHWETSAMAQAARDPIFHACLSVANQDAAFAGDLCLRCHTPGGWLAGRSVPNDVINFEDILLDVLAFQLNTYDDTACMQPCQ